MKKLFGSLFFICLALFANAQSETTTLDYALEGETSVKQQRRNINLKRSNPNRFSKSNLLLGLTLQQAIENGTLMIYEDKKCQNAIPTSQAKDYLINSSIDTIIMFDANTYQEKRQIISVEQVIFPGKKVTYTLTQNWSFDEKSKQLDMNIEKVQVNRLISHNDANNTDARANIFSFKNGTKNTISSVRELDKPNIVWAEQIDYTVTYDNEKLRTALLSQKHLNEHKIVLGYDKKSLFPQEELVKIVNGDVIRDTIITFDPNTFEEKISIIESKQPFDAEHITDFRVSQEFYFDAGTNTIKSRILAIAPIRKQNDENGKFQYDMLLFWIVYSDDFLAK